uniref:MADF domain-containing protein n=1 Tax=Stomoxys calcitrans TaxID=35570 RepID=A0A1I8NSG9_STOCA
MWNKKLVELLITKYQEHSNLYNTKNSNYLDRSKRTRSLNAIANELKQYCEEITVEDIKRKIHTLRSQYIRELREHHKRSDSGIKLWCFDQLEFLRPFSSLRSSQSYAPIKKPSRSDHDEDTLQDELEYEEVTLDTSTKWEKKNPKRYSSTVETKQSPQHDNGTLQDDLEFEEVAIETNNKWEQKNPSKRYSNAVDMTTSKRQRHYEEEQEQYGSAAAYVQSDEMSLEEPPETATHESYHTYPTGAQETSIEITTDLSNGDMDDLIDVEIDEEDMRIMENVMPRSKESQRLQQELCKAETDYYISKARYFSKLTENTQIKRALMVLQSRKLQLEIDKLTRDN